MEELIWGQTMSNFTGSVAERPLEEQVLRIMVPVSCRSPRIALSNRFGDSALIVRRLTISQSEDACVDVTFGGAVQCSVPVGQRLVSDAVELELSPGWLDIRAIPESGQTGKTLGSGLDASTFSVPAAYGENQFYWGIEGVFACVEKPVKPVCFFGDSLTNQGRYSGPASRMLLESGDGIATFNCGISGNRLLHDAAGDSLWTPSFGAAALSRFMRDVTFGGTVNPVAVFALIGVNDLYQPGAGAPEWELPRPGEIVSGLKRLRSDAEKMGTKLVLGTLSPFKGSVGRCLPAWSEAKEALRTEANDFIRKLPKGEWVDVDVLVRDSADPRALDPVADCGDHLHFSIEGGRRVGAEVARALLSALA